MFMIPDMTWKFGAGRYTQKAGALEGLGAEIARLGTKPLVIAGKRAWAAAGDAARKGLSGTPHLFQTHSGPCCEETARQYTLLTQKERCDVVVGIGGGVVMDTAKLTAELSGLPVITAPTISATCAAFAPLSVVYTPEGGTRGSWYYEREVGCVIADMNVLSCQPLRYAASGIVDSLAKKIEIDHNLKGVELSAELSLARAIAAYTYDRLSALAPHAAAALESGAPNALLDELVYLCIPATGIVSGAARGQMQASLAHCLYESVRTVFTREAAGALHGEIVGVGLRMLLACDEVSTEPLDALMDALTLPKRLSDIGVPTSEDALEKLCDTMMSLPYVENTHDTREKIFEALKGVR